MKKLLSIIAILLLLVVLVGCIPDSLLPGGNSGSDGSGDKTPSGTINPSDEPDDDFEDYGLPVINVDLSKLTIAENGLYTSTQEVGAYLYLYHKLPKNFVTKDSFNKSNVTSSNKLSTGGDYFGNYEGFLPKGKNYRECDIDYRGGNRNAKRIVYSTTDWTIFYTSDHYASFSILRFFE